MTPQISKDRTAKAIATQTSDSSNKFISLVSWLFLIGSLILLSAETLELIEGVSSDVVLEFLGSLIFVIGSMFFVSQNVQQ